MPRRERAPVLQDSDLLRRLLRARDRMDAASNEEWPVRRPARISGVSEAHFARSFRQASGIPPHRYQLARRIERATALPRDTDRPVTEIAFATGWQSLGTYGRTGAQAMRAMVAKGATDRYGTVDAGFRDSSGNGWKMIQAKD